MLLLLNDPKLVFRAVRQGKPVEKWPADQVKGLPTDAWIERGFAGAAQMVQMGRVNPDTGAVQRHNLPFGDYDFRNGHGQAQVGQEMAQVASRRDVRRVGPKQKAQMIARNGIQVCCQAEKKRARLASRDFNKLAVPHNLGRAKHKDKQLLSCLALVFAI